MMTIELKINDRLVGKAVICNISEVGGAHDNYSYQIWNNGHEGLGILSEFAAGTIRGHLRAQSPWALVRKVIGGLLGETEKV